MTGCSCTDLEFLNLIGSGTTSRLKQLGMEFTVWVFKHVSNLYLDFGSFFFFSLFFFFFSFRAGGGGVLLQEYLGNGSVEDDFPKDALVRASPTFGSRHQILLFVGYG
jgi:hypothetical protein